MNEQQLNGKIRLVVFDLAGTTVDHGCIAPVAAFVRGFKNFGIDISSAQARGPMGMEKRAHIQALAALDDIAAQWRNVHGRDINATDIDAMYQAFSPMLLDSLAAYSALIPGVEECIRFLGTRGTGYAATTGYFRAAADIVLEQARKFGFAPQASCCATEVPSGRPAPWMIYRCMESLGVYPPASVVNVGDTPVDVASGRNAGVWSVGVTASGNAVGLAAAELAALSREKKQDLLEPAAKDLLAAGAHFVIASVAELPPLLETIEQGLVRGETPD